MFPFVRILLGTLITIVILWASVALYGLLAVWSPFPRTWWIHHMSWVTVGSITLTVLPCIVVLGVTLSKVYRQRAVTCALASSTIALLVAFASSWGEPQEFASEPGWTLGYFGPFLFGPPLVVLILQRLRSNNRWSGP